MARSAPNSESSVIVDERVRELFDRIGFAADPGKRLVVEANILLNQVDNLLLGRNNEWLAAYGLSLAKIGMLLLLRAAPEHHMSMTDISKNMIVTGANITQLADGLERSGLIRRVRPESDRRVVLAELTAEGLELIDRVGPEHYRFMSEAWSDVSEEEIAMLTRLLIKAKHSVARQLPR